MMLRYENWRKSTYSAPDGDCVEVGSSSAGMVGVRDSKEGDSSAALEFTPREWSAFLQAVRSR
ncbi:DUF397 domain-containing protein [Actinomadura sp. 9N407]|uniref:DUF397 domain-containing protein n=1 Tax=Actinomadura sp. 9N407 TaxID=3375154 RepID=UPI0037B0D02D